MTRGPIVTTLTKKQQVPHYLIKENYYHKFKKIVSVPTHVTMWSNKTEKRKPQTPFLNFVLNYTSLQNRDIMKI